MSEQILNRFHQRCHSEAEQWINDRWPGGVSAMLSQYAAGTITLKDITNKTGVLFRGIKRLMSHHGVQPRQRNDALRLARKLNPEWNAHISKAKLRKPYYHPPDIQKAATEKRVRTVRADPSRHGLAHAAMSNRERQFADMLERHGVAYRFNEPAAHYFLDFYLCDISVGIEVQRSQLRPVPERDAAIRRTLNLRTILYVPTQTMRYGHADEIERMVAGLLVNPPDFACLGDCRFFTIRAEKIQATVNGFGFMQRWKSACTSDRQH